MSMEWLAAFLLSAIVGFATLFFTHICGASAANSFFFHYYQMFCMLKIWRDSYLSAQLGLCYDMDAYVKFRRLLLYYKYPMPANCIDTLVDKCFEHWKDAPSKDDGPLVSLLRMTGVEHPAATLSSMCKKLTTEKESEKNRTGKNGRGLNVTFWEKDGRGLNVTSFWDLFASLASNSVIMNDAKVMQQVSRIVSDAPLLQKQVEGCTLGGVWSAEQQSSVPIPGLGFSLWMICTIAETLSVTSSADGVTVQQQLQYCAALVSHCIPEDRALGTHSDQSMCVLRDKIVRMARNMDDADLTLAGPILLYLLEKVGFVPLEEDFRQRVIVRAYFSPNNDLPRCARQVMAACVALPNVSILTLQRSKSI
jgi:hypothetical protein